VSSTITYDEDSLTYFSSDVYSYYDCTDNTYTTATHVRIYTLTEDDTLYKPDGYTWDQFTGLYYKLETAYAEEND